MSPYILHSSITSGVTIPEPPVAERVSGVYKVPVVPWFWSNLESGVQLVHCTYCSAKVDFWKIMNTYMNLYRSTSTDRLDVRLHIARKESKDEHVFVGPTAVHNQHN